MHSCLSLNSESGGMSGRQGQRRMGFIRALDRKWNSLVLSTLPITLPTCCCLHIPVVFDPRIWKRRTKQTTSSMCQRYPESGICVQFMGSLRRFEEEPLTYSLHEKQGMWKASLQETIQKFALWTTSGLVVGWLLVKKANLFGYSWFYFLSNYRLMCHLIFLSS